MIGFDDTVRVLLGDVARGGYQFLDHSRVGWVSDRWSPRTGEESLGGRQIPLRDGRARRVRRRIRSPCPSAIVRLRNRPVLTAKCPAIRGDRGPAEGHHPG
jgi:hypothetical protein